MSAACSPTRHSVLSICYTERSLCHSERSLCHSERSTCHSERSTCHSERSTCHSERSICHSERSEESGAAGAAPPISNLQPPSSLHHTSFAF